MNRRQLKSAYSKLQRFYGPITRTPGGQPLDQLVATILSQNTSDTNSERAYRDLRKAYPTWDKVVAAPASGIARSIKHGGLANTKSKSIKKVLQIVREREGKLSLARLRRMDDAEAMDYLTSMPGVGVKTAACVLMFSLGRPVMPVDTHVFRVSSRLGWLPDGTRPEQAGELLERAMPNEMVYPMHLYLVQHGREICKAQRPKCSECPLAAGCASAKG